MAIALALIVLAAWVAAPFVAAYAVKRSEEAAVVFGFSTFLPWTLFGLWIIG